MTSLPETPSRRTRVVLGAILGAALVLRLLYLSYATERPGFHIDDPDSYLRQGERITHRYSMDRLSLLSSRSPHSRARHFDDATTRVLIKVPDPPTSTRSTPRR